MSFYHIRITKALTGLLFTLSFFACKKLVNIPDPNNTITTKQVFSTDEQANSAMAGIYTQMINGSTGSNNSIFNGFCTGLTTLLAGLSSDELIVTQGPAWPNLYIYNQNNLSFNDAYVTNLWNSAYTAIYGANAVIEGIAASTSGDLRDSVRKELTGEAKFIRAFCHFYLINLFGDVPLVLTIDFNQTRNMAKTPKVKVYEQIIRDLQDAQSLLVSDYSVEKSERIRPNKWAATALLARAYLYTADYSNAAIQAGAVIAHSDLFGLEADVNSVFAYNSREAIWQLKQNSSMQGLGTATPEGKELLPTTLQHGRVSFNLSNQLLDAFEPGDQRRAAWVDSTDNTVFGPAGLYYFAYKYKTGLFNYVLDADPSEYYMVLRLAEQYLIRAEAEANGASGGTDEAMADLNVLRRRAGLSDLSTSLNQTQVIAAVAHERQIELFAEWGHRWFDLKRTGEAHNVLSGITMKQPWKGDYQLLYPLPTSELTNDPNLKQNPGY